MNLIQSIEGKFKGQFVCSIFGVDCFCSEMGCGAPVKEVPLEPPQVLKKPVALDSDDEDDSQKKQKDALSAEEMALQIRKAIQLSQVGVLSDVLNESLFIVGESNVFFVFLHFINFETDIFLLFQLF